VKDIDRYNATCWLLSPPCQPYTNGGQKKDTEDPRAKALLHLIDLLPQLDVIPKYVFLENVKNFEVQCISRGDGHIMNTLIYMMVDFTIQKKANRAT